MSDFFDLRQMKVSIIIPCYNSNLEWLFECLLSVSQSLEAYDGEAEVMVVDDGSDFCIESGVKEFLSDNVLRRIRFCRKANGGLSSARNFGMRNTRGEWCHFIDDDDIIEKGFYQEMANQADATHTDLVFAESRFFGEIEREFKISTGNIINRLVIGNVVHVNAVFARRSMLERLGGFDEQLNGLEDWDMWLRCARTGAAVSVIHSPLASVRVHRTSMSTNRPRMNSRMTQLSMREWRDHFDFWSLQSVPSSRLARDWGLAGLSYALRSEAPFMNALKFYQLMCGQLGFFRSSVWFLRQTIKHILKPERSEHTFQ
jgi:glycosyltransferase involved in cell wall biosynthesis